MKIENLTFGKVYACVEGFFKYLGKRNSQLWDFIEMYYDEEKGAFSETKNSVSLMRYEVRLLVEFY